MIRRTQQDQDNAVHRSEDSGGRLPEPDHLVIYPGNMPLGEREKSPTPPPPRSAMPPRRNRKAVRRRISPFNIMLMLIGAAIAIVLYISNIIAVNQLMNTINALETEHREILMEQEILRARINRLASLERIQERAEELGLQSLREPPVWINVDRDRIREIEEAAPTP